MPDEAPNTPETPAAAAPAVRPADPGTVLPTARSGYGGMPVSNDLPVMPEPAKPAPPKDEPCPDCPPADAAPEVIVLGGEGLTDEFIQMFYSFRSEDEGAQKIGEALMAKRKADAETKKETTQAAALRDLGIYVHPAPETGGSK